MNSPSLDRFEDMSEVVEEIDDSLPAEARRAINDLLRKGQEIRNGEIIVDDPDAEYDEIVDELEVELEELGVGDRVAEMRDRIRTAYAAGVNPSDGWLPEREESIDL